MKITDEDIKKVNAGKTVYLYYNPLKKRMEKRLSECKGDLVLIGTVVKMGPKPFLIIETLDSCALAITESIIRNFTAVERVNVTVTV